MSFVQALDVAFYAFITIALPAAYVALPALTAAVCIGKAIEFVTVLFTTEE